MDDHSQSEFRELLNISKMMWKNLFGNNKKRYSSFTPAIPFLDARSPWEKDASLVIYGAD